MTRGLVGGGAGWTRQGGVEVGSCRRQGKKNYALGMNYSRGRYEGWWGKQEGGTGLALLPLSSTCGCPLCSCSVLICLICLFSPPFPQTEWRHDLRRHHGARPRQLHPPRDQHHMEVWAVRPPSPHARRRGECEPLCSHFCMLEIGMWGLMTAASLVEVRAVRPRSPDARRRGECGLDCLFFTLFLACAGMLRHGHGV